METAKSEPARGPRLTWPEEIKAAYPDQWVILGDLDMDEVTLQVHSAVVLAAGKTRREVIAKAPVTRGEITARFFTGRMHLPPPRW